ncbi:MAG: immunoglobulin domain-containing protein [Bacteroidia bacterium]
MKTKFIAIILSLFTSHLFAQPFLNWAGQLQGTNTVKRIKSSVTDNDGNIYNYGDFNGTVDFDPGVGVFNLTSQGMDIFVQKLSRTGELIWAIRIGASGTEEAGHITYSTVTDKIIINGKFQFFGSPGMEVDFDPGTGVVNPIENRNHFILRLWGNNAAFDWLGLMNLPQGTIGPMLIDSNQDFYLTGNYHAPSGNIDLNPAPAVNLNYNTNAGANFDAFVIKMSNAGSLLWARHIRSQNTSGRLNINSIDILGSSQIFIGGELFGQIHPEYDLTTNMLHVLTSAGGSDAIIYGYPTNLSTGGYLYGIHTINNEGIYSLKLSRTNFLKIFTTGYFNGTMNITPPTNSAFHLTSAGLADQFITCLNLSGNVLWSNRTGSQYNEQGLHLALNNRNDVYVLTQLEGNNGTIDINPNAGNQTVNMQFNDILIQKLDSNGIYQYGHIFADGNAYPRGINTWNTNNVYISGDLESAGNFDSDPTNGIFNLTGYGSNATGINVVLNDCSAPLNITNNSPVCSANAINLSAPSISGASYNWSGPNSFTSTSNTVNISNAQAINAGTYILNTTVNGCVYPTVQTNVTVNNNTAITAQPSNVTICSGNTLTLSVTATGTSLSYQWRKNGVNITGATNATYTVTNANSTHSGNYDVIVSGTCGSITSSVAVVDIQNFLPAPGPYTGPTTFCQNVATTISVPALPGATSYTWTLPGGWSGSSTTNTITVTTPFSGGGGIISVRGNNSCGLGNVLNINVFSSVNLSSIGTISGNTTICANTTQTYSVSSVTGATSYTWILPSGWSGSSTTNSISVNAGTNSDTIKVFASNSCSNSNVSSLFVNVNNTPAAPAIITGNANVCIVPNFTSTQTYSVTPVPGATSYTWTLSSGLTGFSTSNTINVTIANSGTISVTANNSCGSSNATTLSINVIPNITPVITSQPLNQSVCLGSSATFSITSTGSSLNYQWRKNGVNIPGANSSSYTINNVTAGDIGNYDVVITNQCNANVVMSQSASLSIASTFNVVSSGLIFYLPFDGNNNEQIQNANNIGTYSYAAADDRFGNPNKAAQFNGTSRLEFASPSQLPVGNSPYTISVWINIPIGQWANTNGICGWGLEGTNLSNRLRLSTSGYVNYWWGNDFNVNASAIFNTWRHIAVTWDGTIQRFYQDGVEIATRTPSSNPNVSLTNLFVGATGISFFGGEPFNGSMDDFRIYNRAITAAEVNELYVFQPLSSVSLPSSLQLCEGQNFSPSATVVGNGSLSYQWLLNGNPISNGGNISGSTTSSLVINSALTSNSGNYQLQVTQGNCVQQTSNPLILTVDPSTINITSQPQSLTVCEGTTASFSATVSGTVISYQWKKDGVNISGATSSTLTINSAQLSDQGSYELEIISNCGLITTQSATLTVNPNAAITQQPQAVGPICVGTSFALNVNAVAASSYQWYFNGSPISGATSSSYSVTNAQFNQTGYYKVEVISAGCGPNILSDSIYIDVITNPVITSNLVGGAYCEGDSMVLEIQVSGIVNSYHWWHNGNNIQITNTPMYVVPSVSSSDQGTYTVVAYNACGGTMASIVNIVVNPTFSQTIQQTICYGDDFVFGNTTYNQSGTYIQSYQTINGCDSTYTIQLNVLPENLTNLSATICDGQQYVLGSQTLTTGGNYQETFVAANGCDSIVQLALTVISSSTVFNQNASICQGDVYVFGNQNLTTSGTYTQTFTATAGCDSVVQLNLTVNSLPNVNVSINGNQLEATSGFVSYQWYFNGLPINGATSNVYIPIQSGSYYVEVEDLNGCQNLSEIVDYNLTGINENALGSLEIYPNPARDIVWIKSDASTQIIISDLSGRIIKEIKIENELKLELSDFSNGIYLVNYLNNKGTAGFKKLVVNK